MLLTVYHRIDSELHSQSENSIRDRMLVDFTKTRWKHGMFSIP